MGVYYMRKCYNAVLKKKMWDEENKIKIMRLKKIKQNGHHFCAIHCITITPLSILY